MKFDWKPVLLITELVVLGALVLWYHSKATEEQQRADAAGHSLMLANDTIDDI